MHLEVEKPDGIAELLDDACELSCAEVRVRLSARTCADYLAGAENQGGAARFADAHDDTVEAGRIVFGVAGAKVDLLQVEVTAETDGGDAVSRSGQNANFTNV